MRVDWGWHVRTVVGLRSSRVLGVDLRTGRAIGAGIEFARIGARWTRVDLWRVRAGIGLRSWRALGVDLRAGRSIGAVVEFGMRCAARVPAATATPTAPYWVARCARRQGGSGRDARRSHRRRLGIGGRPD